MAELLNINLLHSSSPPSLPLILSPLPFFPLMRSFSPKRRLSRSKLSTRSNSTKLCLIYTIEHSDGTLLFKFGDESEVPEVKTDSVDVSDTASLDYGENEVELEGETDISSADAVISNVEEINDEDGDVDVNVSETAPLTSEDVGIDVELESGSEISAAAVENCDDSTVGDSLKGELEVTAIPEESGEPAEENNVVDVNENETASLLSEDVEKEVELKKGSDSGVGKIGGRDDFSVDDSVKGDSVKDELDHSELIATLEVEDFDDSEILTDDTTDVLTELVSEDSKVGVISEGGVSDVESSDREVISEDKESDESLEDVVSQHDDGEEEMVELPPLQLEGEPILDEEVDDTTSPTISLSEDSQMTDEAYLARCYNTAIAEIPTVRLSVPQAAASSSLQSEVNDGGLHSITGQEDDLRHSDVSDVAFPGPATLGMTSTTISDSSYDGDILQSPLVAAKLPDPLKANDATPAILKSDDNECGSDISEPGRTGHESSGTGPTVPTETSLNRDLNSMETSAIAFSMPSAAASSPDALEVNDVAIPTIRQSDDDVHSDASAADGPVPGTSGIIAAETSLREEIPATSLSLASAAASLTHSAEALAGGDDAYFICDNWFGVADGVGQWSFGGIHKGLYAQEFMQNCDKLARKSENAGLTRVKELLQQSATMTEAAGSARVLIGHVTDQVLHVANIGDSGFVVIRNGNVFTKSTPMFHEFNFPYAIGSDDDMVEAIEEYHAELEDGDIIVTATDGLFDNLYEQEIASLVCKGVDDGKNVKDLAELLAAKAQEVGGSASARTPFADAAQATGHMGITGGKFDHVTVIVSAVQKV